MMARVVKIQRAYAISPIKLTYLHRDCYLPSRLASQDLCYRQSRALGTQNSTAQKGQVKNVVMVETRGQKKKQFSPPETQFNVSSSYHKASEGGSQFRQTFGQLNQLAPLLIQIPYKITCLKTGAVTIFRSLKGI